MDLSYDAVAASCAEQMAMYQKCVLDNQDKDWSSICRPQGRALAACADASVPHLAQLKQACFEPIEAYKQCLNRNAAEKDEVVAARCEGLMRAVWECSERAMEGLQESPPTGGEGQAPGRNTGRLV